jgi:SP family sugar:H+ symporter-like MFS transporter
MVENIGRRKSMLGGAAWMAVCLFIYSFVGQYMLDHANPLSTPQAGNIMIVFTCLFIAAFATTWGPLVWAIVGELYPARYRATGMAVAVSLPSSFSTEHPLTVCRRLQTGKYSDVRTACETYTDFVPQRFRLFNFIISFCSTLITDRIDYFYGLVFAVSLVILFFIVYFFMIETKGRSLEEVDTMYILHVNPITSSKWDASSLAKDGLVDTDRLHMGAGGRTFSKAEQAGHTGGVLEPAERNEIQV